MPSGSSSPDGSYNYTHKKKRRHKSVSPKYRENEHRHGGTDRRVRDRHEDRDRERREEHKRNHSREYHRSRSPVSHRDQASTSKIKRERHDPGYDKALHHSHDVAERRKHDRLREQRRQQQDEENWGTSTTTGEDSEKPKDQPNFGLSGKLAEETNTYKGVVIKYNEPPEARKPRKKWRLYPFKGDDALPVMHIHRQSAYLLGRDRRIADLPIDHPSCSKQHAVLQYRLVEYKRDDGRVGLKVKPYIIDLGSANGTYVNNQRIDSERYVELFEKDVLKFGFSSREYVLLHDNVKVTDLSDEN